MLAGTLTSHRFWIGFLAAIALYYVWGMIAARRTATP